MVVPDMATVALVVHTGRPKAVELAREAAEWLSSRGHQVKMPKEALSPPGPAAGWASTGVIVDDLLAGGLDLAVSLGGDGTMLRAVDAVSSHGVPVMGVNLGRLGYLTGVEPAQLNGALEAFVDGRYQVEERTMLAVEVHKAGSNQPVATYRALNEAVLEKPTAGHTVNLAVSIDGRPFISYAADGLIVATPTGSTAYAFSARGPIMSPRLCAMLLTPVSPHMPFDRSLVLDSAEVLRIEVVNHRPAILIVDGRELGLLDGGDAICCAADPQPARFVVIEPRDFYAVLKAKFGLADR